MAKEKRIPTNNKVCTIKKGTPPTDDTTDDIVCPDIDTTPDVKEVHIDEPTVLNISCPTPNVTCPPGVDPQLFQATMQPLIRKISSLVKFSEMQLCLFSKFVENSNTKIIKCDVCFSDGTSGTVLSEYTEEGGLVNIGYLNSIGLPTDLEVVPCSDFEFDSLDAVCYETPNGDKYTVQIVREYTNNVVSGTTTIIINNLGEIVDELPVGSVPCSDPAIKVIPKDVCLSDGTKGLMWIKFDLITEETIVLKITNCDGSNTTATVVECPEYDIIETTACSSS